VKGKVQDEVPGHGDRADVVEVADHEQGQERGGRPAVEVGGDEREDGEERVDQGHERGEDRQEDEEPAPGSADEQEAPEAPREDAPDDRREEVRSRSAELVQA
jgi:hypothetical protein